MPQKSSNIPKGWPPDVIYLNAPHYSNNLNPSELHTLHSSDPGKDQPATIALSPGPSPLVRIRPIIHPSHPANKQHGLFAAKNLPSGSFILFYLGFVHGKSETNPSSRYDLSLDRELGIGVDATTMGNEARFINDYRGVNLIGPNAEFRDVWVDVGKGRVEKRVGVFVLSAGKAGKRVQGIRKGEEVLISYGKGFWSDGDH